MFIWISHFNDLIELSRSCLLQVQVDSADNHDRTREFLWQKSSHIAQVVSQKLTSAARSMLQKPPKSA